MTSEEKSDDTMVGGPVGASDLMPECETDDNSKTRPGSQLAPLNVRNTFGFEARDICENHCVGYMSYYCDESICIFVDPWPL